MPSCALILASALMGTGSAFERAEAFLASQDRIKVRLEAVFPVSETEVESVPGSYADVRPNRQRFILEDGADAVEVRQDPTLQATYYPGTRTYDETPSGPVVLRSAGLSGRTAFAYPLALAARSLQVYGPAELWKPVGGSGGVEVIEAEVPTLSGTQVYRVGVLADGRISEFTERPGGAPARFGAGAKCFDYGQPSAEEAALMTPHLPAGYVPVPLPRGRRTLSAGERAPLGRWPSAGSQGSISPDALMGSKGLAVVFADPATPAGQALAAEWPAVEKELNSMGIETLEIVMQGARPATDSGSKLADPNGRLERAFGLESAPHIFILERERTIFAAWSGWRAGEAKPFLEMTRKRLSQLAELAQG